MPHDIPPLAGRTPLVADIVRRAQTGHGTILLGAPGSGRSRILADVATALGRTGVRSAHVVVTPEVAAAPFGVFAPLLGRETIAGIAGSASPTPLATLRAAVADLGLRALVVDGAPNLDKSVATLMLDVARRGAAVIVAATSEQDAYGALTALADHGFAASVAVPPLSLEDTRTLAEHLLDGHIDGQLAAALATASGQLPGPLCEFVQHGADSGAIARTGALWRLRSPLATPPTLRARVAVRLSGLTAAERGWTAAVAVAGSIADDIAPRIARRSAVEGAHRAGWTCHDHASGSTRMLAATDARAVAESLDDRARRIVLHRLVEAVAASERPLSDSERVALAGWRLELGERPEAEEAVALADLPGIHGAAREQLLRAAIAEGARAHASLADHLQRTRRPGEAAEIVDAAFDVADSAGERTDLARVRAVATGLVERRSGEALATLDAHIAEHGEHPDLTAVRAGLLLFEGRPREALETAESVLGEPGYAGMIALAHAVVCHRELGCPDEGAAMAVRFGAVAGRSGSPLAEGPGLAEYLLPDARLTAALELHSAELALLDVYQHTGGRRGADDSPSSAYSLGRIRLLRGDPLGAVHWFRAADAGAGTWRDSCLPRVVAGLTAALAVAGELDAAAQTAERLRLLVTPPLHRGRTGLALAQLAASRGDRDGAVAAAAEVEHDGVRLGLALDAFDGAYDGIRFGDERAAARLLALGPVPEGAGRAAQRAHARAVRDGGAAAIGDAATDLWEAGLALYAIEAAASAAAGDTAAAGRLVVWAARTPGVHLRGATDRRAGMLTSREREVAGRAALGLSDRLIAAELGIALRTAQTHLTRAYAKLGVHRRADLAVLIGPADDAGPVSRRRT